MPTLSVCSVHGRRRRRFWLKLAAGLLFAAVAYGGAYRMCLDPIEAGIVQIAAEDGTTVNGPGGKEVFYTPDMLGVETFFAPAHWLDRKLRPRYWGLR